MKHCCWNVFNIADLFCHFCHLASSINRTARLHTWQSWLKTGLLPTAVNSLLKMNGLQTRLTSTLWTTMSAWGATLERYKSFQIQPMPENIDELKKVLQLIWDQLPQDLINRPYWASRKDFGLVWKLVVDTSNTTLKWTTCQILVFVTVNVFWQWKLQVAVDYSVQNWKHGIEYLYSLNFGKH